MEKYIIKTDIIQENNENELEKIVEIEEEGANEKNKENTDTNYHNNETKNYEKNNINNANAINVNKNASVAFKDRVKFMEIKKSEDKIKHFQAEPKKEEKPVDSNAPHKNTISEKEEKYLKRALKNRKDKKKEDEIIHHSSKISSIAGTLENQLFKKELDKSEMTPNNDGSYILESKIPENTDVLNSLIDDEYANTLSNKNHKTIMNKRKPGKTKVDLKNNNE